MSATGFVPSDSSSSLEPLLIHFTSEPDIGELAPNAYHHWLGDDCADMEYSICIPPDFPHLLEASALLGELLVRNKPPSKGLSKREARLECLQWQKYYPVKVLFELETPLTEMIHNLLVFSDTAYLKDYDCKESDHYKVLYLSLEEAAAIDGPLRESLIKVCALVVLLQRAAYAIQASQGQWEKVANKLGVERTHPRRDPDYLELVAARTKLQREAELVEAEGELENENEKKKTEKEARLSDSPSQLPLNLGTAISWVQNKVSWITSDFGGTDSVGSDGTDGVEMGSDRYESKAPGDAVHDITVIPSSSSSSIASPPPQKAKKRSQKKVAEVVSDGEKTRLLQTKPSEESNTISSESDQRGFQVVTKSNSKSHKQKTNKQE